MARGTRLTAFGLVCALALPAATRAQLRPADGAERGVFMQRINTALDQLKLTADEKTKIDDVLHDAREDAMKLRDELAGLAPQARREKLKEFAATVTRKIDAELTPEQAKEFDAKLAAAQTAEPPSATARPGQGGGRGGKLEQSKAAIDKLDLSTDQKQKIHDVFEDLRPKIAELRSAEPAERREKVTALFSQLHTKLGEILTPQQQQALRESMQSASAANTGATTRPAAAPQAMMMDDNGMMAAAPPKDGAAAAPPAPAAKAAPAGYAVGDTVADLKLDRLDQSPANLSIYKGRVVALVFGSYSCPMFRDHAEDLNQLSRQLASDAAVVLVYTRESNPQGARPIDRNKEAHISMKQTVTAEDRRAAAQAAKDALRLVTPIVVDDPADTLADAFGVLPNGCVVLNRSGAVSARFRWFDAVATKHAVDKALASPVVMTAPASPADLR